jgi:hypothetical protein
MEKRRSKARPISLPPPNQRRGTPGFLAVVGGANRRAHEQANQRSGRRGLKSMKATISDSAPEFDDGEDFAGLGKRLLRWSLALLLLPLCWVTAWTFLSMFSQRTMNEGFWQSAEFWYFATGMLLMIGWFWSGLLQSFFLYLYVLGHELTHAVFVVLYRGKVTDFHVSTSGGYITTNKTNLMIALSPYFVPWWSVVAVTFFVLARLFFDLSKPWDLALYGIMGLTWTFHVVWTIWMIPRDQPDLRENGTFLSLVVIFFGNLLVLVGLLCLAADSPVASFKDFGREWLRHAATWSDVGLRWLTDFLLETRRVWKL